MTRYRLAHCAGSATAITNGYRHSNRRPVQFQSRWRPQNTRRLQNASGQWFSKQQASIGGFRGKSESETFLDSLLPYITKDQSLDQSTIYALALRNILKAILTSAWMSPVSARDANQVYNSPSTCSSRKTQCTSSVPSFTNQTTGSCPSDHVTAIPD